MPTPIVITKKDLMVEESQELCHLAVQIKNLLFLNFGKGLKEGSTVRRGHQTVVTSDGSKYQYFGNLPEHREPRLVSTYCIMFCYSLPLNKAFSQ